VLNKYAAPLGLLTGEDVNFYKYVAPMGLCVWRIILKIFRYAGAFLDKC